MNLEATGAPPLDVHGDDPRDEIVRLETRLDELADSLTRCRKIRVISQTAMAGGGVWLAGTVTGIIGFDPSAMIVAIAGMIGGAVMYGSNGTTAEEFEAEVKAAEAQRTALIGRLDLHVIGE